MISTLIKETPESTLTPSARGEYNRKSLIWRKALIQSRWQLHLRLPSLQNCEEEIAVVSQLPSMKNFVSAT